MDQKAEQKDTSSLDNVSGSPNKGQGKEKEICQSQDFQPQISNKEAKRTHLHHPTPPHLCQIQSVPPVTTSPYLPSEKISKKKKQRLQKSSCKCKDAAEKHPPA